MKSAKLYGLKSEFENFKKKDDETIIEMFYRLQVIVNDLKTLGHKTKDEDFCHKFLMTLPKRFKMLIMMLQRDGIEDKKPNDLLGEVLTFDKYDHETDEQEKEESKKKQTVAFKATSSKGKAQIQEEDEDDEDEEFVIDDEALALVVRKMGKMFIKRRGFKKRSEGKAKEQSRKCFNCDSPDHLQADCPYEKKKHKKGNYEKKKREVKMTFKKGKDGAFLVTWESDDEDDDDEQDKKSNKAFASIAINKKPSLFSSSPSCFMAKETKVKYDDSDDDSDIELVHDDDANIDDDDEPNVDQLYDMLEQTKNIAIAKSKECKSLSTKVEILEKVLCELKASHECLRKDHEELEFAHTKIKKEHFLLLSKSNDHKVVSSCNVGISCDILDEAFFEPIIVSSANPSCSSSSITTNSISTSSDSSLLVENETLKREVGELTHALGKAYGGEALLLKFLGCQKLASDKEGLGYIPKHGKAAFATSKPSFMRSDGRYCTKCKQVGHLEHKCNKMNHNKKNAYAYSIRFDSCYVLTKGEKGVRAKFVGTPKKSPKMKAIWVPKSLVTNLQGPQQKWVPKSH